MSELATLTRPADGVRLVTIARPATRNAINDALAMELSAHFARFDDDPEARVCVLTGADGGFSAGLDLKAFANSGEVGECPERGFAGITRRPPRKPVIAAVEGYALAGGLEIALACDLIVAARDARIGIPEVKRGLAADGGALLRLPRKLPGNVAMHMALTGDEVSVERLHGWGLVNVVAEPGQAVAAAVDLARAIAENAPLGVLGSKSVLTASPSWSPHEVWDRQQEILAPVWSSDDAEEGARAFAEKRPPVFRGH